MNIIRFPSTLSGWLESNLGLDLRSLAFFRITLGLLLLADLIRRIPDLESFDTDFGVMPRTEMLAHFSRPWEVSLHLANGSLPFQCFLFILAAIFAVCLLVGLKTRLFTCLSWFFLLSLHNRNWMINHSGDDLLRMMLFWSMFLPLGARFSMDRLLDSSKATSDQPSPKCFSGGAVGYMAQIVMLYWMSVVLKNGPEWREAGTAIYYALSIDYVTGWIGQWIRLLPENILKITTHAVFWTEAIAPALLVCPAPSGSRLQNVRFLGVMMLMALHAGILMGMNIGLFPWIDLVSLIPFLPEAFWTRVGKFEKIWRTLRQWLVEKLGNMEGLRSTPPNKPHSPVYDAVAMVFVTLVVIINLQTITPNVRVPEFAGWAVQLFKLEQFWGMFSPAPAKSHGWFVIPGKLQNGREVDLFNRGLPVRWEEPRDIPALFRNDRWWKYLEKLWSGADRDHVLTVNYGRHLCRAWNREHAKQPDMTLLFLDIHFMEKHTLPDGGYSRKRHKLWRHHCFPQARQDHSATNIAKLNGNGTGGH